jgi:hypothetical protein
MCDKKYKFMVLFIAVLLVLGLTLPACTCQKPTETEKPSAPPGQPAALSFEAAEYTNTDYGFSVKYPKDWKETTAISGPGVLFVAQAPAQVPVLIVNVAEGATLADAVTAAVEEAGGSDVTINSQSETTLADGTKATQVTGTYKHPMAPMAIDAFILGAKKDNKWIIVTVATVGLLAKFDEAKFSEIAHTLEFK